jgi:hypothetical protein
MTDCDELIAGLAGRHTDARDSPGGDRSTEPAAFKNRRMQLGFASVW